MTEYDNNLHENNQSNEPSNSKNIDRRADWRRWVVLLLCCLSTVMLNYFIYIIFILKKHSLEIIIALIMLVFCMIH